jgi:hypothetical protein
MLRELVTETSLKCVCPNRYPGTPGEIWFTRIFPELFPELGFGYSVIFITPYIVGRSDGEIFKKRGSHDCWKAFLARTLENEDSITGYEKLMKYGLARHYWNEYIFHAFANYTDKVVYLTGIPDRPDTLPFLAPDF